MTALIGAALIAGPAIAADAASPTTHHHHSAAMKRDTVEQRISGLHTALMITPDEEANWTGVAQAMRDNESGMQKLVAERTDKPPASMTAVEDLRIYERFNEAHVTGLKNLIASFETLYATMPDAQKVIADQVFRKYGGRGPQHAS